MTFGLSYREKTGSLFHVTYLGAFLSGKGGPNGT